MCLAVPGKIVEIEGAGDEITGPVAVVDFQGNRVQASLAAVPDAAVGDWVLVHAGFAITTLDEEEARQTFEVLQEAMGEIPLPGVNSDA